MEKWERYLSNTKEKNYNLERLKSLKENSSHLVYEYVKRSLNILDSMDLDDNIYFYVKETLKWMDVSKTGDSIIRKEWKQKGFDLFVHNIGSSQIYVDTNKDYNEVVRVLILTHGLVGQYIRGEGKLSDSKELYELIKKKLISKNELKKILIVLNECVISASSKEIYESIKNDVNKVIDYIINGDFDHEYSITERIAKLNSDLTIDDEKELKKILSDKKVSKLLDNLFDNVSFWYYEVSIGSFSITEQIKILLLCSLKMNSNIKNLSFESIMKSIYLDYKDTKMVNIFKKRIIEQYLKNMEISDILDKYQYSNSHVTHKIKIKNEIILFDFKFSIQASKLIDFCMVAYVSDSLYKKSIYLLYDLFGFRKDKYDRFYNEIEYLNRMNSSMQYKAKILDYIVRDNVLDVGPGGGALLDLIEDRNPLLNVYAIDISSNVIDELSKKKKKENKSWNLVKGDALNLTDYFEKGSLDSIIYSSIIHELYSYIPYKGKKFNIETVVQALKSAYEILPVGGRIIIRDGIKTEPEDIYRIIKFNNTDDIKILDRYCSDFKGREVTYEKVSKDSVRMLVNDAMEFLYTYTWGEDSYPLEVQEQFGYLTPTEYKKLINDNLPNSDIIVCEAFLQDGYEENLLNKISIYDDNMNIVKLPNSTCIIVIEKH